MSRPGVLETAKYFVLLALAEEPGHGYAVAGRLIGDSVGGVYLRPSSLYATLKSLERDGLIERWGESEIHAGRKLYRLTERGRQRLADAARMHERAAQLAKERLGLRY